MASEHEIVSLMNSAMKSLRELIDVNTIVGDIIENDDGLTVIPISKVSCGFVAGGGDLCSKVKENTPFAGGSGAGINVQPVGFVVLAKDQVRFIPVSGATAFDKAIDALPILVEQIEKVIGKKPDSNIGHQY